MDDNLFLDYCESHSRTPRCGFVPASIARLCRLSGRNEAAERWEREPNRVVNCNPQEIRTLVAAAKKLSGRV